MLIGVVGLGLIGASMSLALKGLGHTVLGMDTDEHTLKYAVLSGAVSREMTEADWPELEMLFLAVYPEAAVETLTRMAPKLRKDMLAADLCGVKRVVCTPCFALAAEYGFTFIGGHPMAGKQFSGIKYASGDLFRGASMILTPREGEDLFRVSRLSDLMHAVGFAAVTVTTPAEHDRMIAFTSQLAHVVANAYVKSPTARDLKHFGGGSYRDMTRVAWLNEDMWTELFLENRQELAHELDTLIGELGKYREALEAGDGERLRTLLREGRKRKEELDAEWKKST